MDVEGQDVVFSPSICIDEYGNAGLHELDLRATRNLAAAFTNVVLIGDSTHDHHLD